MFKSVFRPSSRISRLTKRVGIRHVTVNPALNHNSSYIYPAVMPFGVNFVDDRLRQALVKRGVNIDDLERDYRRQIQNEQEFDTPVLPRDRNSKIWGYVYGDKLVQSKVRLETLDEEREGFMRNYLNALVNDLSNRMDRVYPDLDYQAQIGSVLKETNEEIDNDFEDVYADTEAEVISRDPSAYLAKIKGNNSFISEYDSDDQFNDYLPREIDSVLLSRYAYSWDQASGAKVDARKYFDRINSFEKAFASSIDGISKDIRNNFNQFVLDSFKGDDISTVSKFIQMISDSTSVATLDESKIPSNAQTLTQGILDGLELSSGIVSSHGAHVLSILFFGNETAASELDGKDTETIREFLTGDVDRLKVVRQAVEIKQYLKFSPASRLILGVLMKQIPSFFEQIFSDGDDSAENLRSFISDNESLVSDIVLAQRDLFSAQAQIADAMKAVSDTLVSQGGLTASDVKNAFDGISGICPVNSQDNCVIIGSLTDAADGAQESGNLYREIKYRSMARYLSTQMGSQKSAFYRGLRGLLSPSRNGFNGDTIESVGIAINTMGSDANEAFFRPLTETLSKTGRVPANEIGALKSTLSGDVSSQWDSLRQAGIAYKDAKANLKANVSRLKFNYDGDLNYGQIRETWSPLDIHLSSHRYLNHL